MSALAKCAIIAVCLVLGAYSMGACENKNVHHSVKLILDTDIGNDIDDALALAMIHDLEDRGEAELLAVTVCKDNPWAAVYVDVVDHFYGRPDVPIGVVHNGKTPDDGPFVHSVSERKENGKFIYPRKLKSGSDAPEAVGLLRRTLAAQPDGSVVIVSIGFMTNLARLLASGPDSASPLSGSELVKRKVRLYSMMAGAFGPNSGPEYNVVVDADAAREVFDHWPTPLVVSGYEVGLAITYPASSIEKDYGYVKNHPIAEAYRAYVQMPCDRPCWDLTAVMYAVRPDSGYFGLSQPGAITLDSGNVTRFAEDSAGKRRYLTVTPDQITRLTEAFTLLVSSPPRR